MHTHRYHQACDLLDKAPPGAPGRDTVNMIFCWLRYSQVLAANNAHTLLLGMHAR